MNTRAAARQLPERSALVWRFMAAWFARYLHRHLNAVRLALWGRPEGIDHAGPIVIYCNHPSWWDAATLILLADRLFPVRQSYAPFDAKMLQKYGIFRKLGAFPVDLDASRGAGQFLEAARAVLARPDRALWITAQGRFADSRARPLGLKAGVARLPEIAPDALLMPLALEVGFWDERGGEAFCAFGPAVSAKALLTLSRPERLARLEADLTATLDRLREDVIARDPARFTALLSGAKGVGGVYDRWRRLSARLARRRFDAAHRPDDASSEGRPS